MAVGRFSERCIRFLFRFLRRPTPTGIPQRVLSLGLDGHRDRVRGLSRPPREAAASAARAGFRAATASPRDRSHDQRP
jgi:hypothetical protein